MKKRLALTLAALLALSACGQEKPMEAPTDDAAETASVQEVRTVWEEPPELTVSCAGESVPALQCTSSWNYQNEDGTMTGINACGASPLQAREDMEPLGTALSESNHAALNFELTPDRVSVRCWSEGLFGQYEEEEVEVEALAADFEDGTSALDYSICLKEGSHVYEVKAEWDRAEEYGGTIWYGFCTE